MNYLKDKINNDIMPKIQYDIDLSSINIKKNNTEEYINPQNGDLTLTYTDYVLPGRNGLDLEIKRIYKSSQANIFKMNTIYENGKWKEYNSNWWGSFYEDRYNLGVGMRFSFPNIEIRKNQDNTKEIYLHAESGEVYKITKSKQGNYLLKDHTVKDIEINEDTSFNTGQVSDGRHDIDGKSKYVMIEKDGKKIYFAEDGRILGMVDRYGNKIKFEYSYVEDFNYSNIMIYRCAITKIIDSVGREIKIEYPSDPWSQVEKNQDGTYSEDLRDKCKVIIYLPNNKKIVYSKNAAHLDGANVVRKKIDKVYDIDGELKYHYIYDKAKLGFTIENEQNYSVKNEYCNLVQVDHRRTNKIVRYDYKTYTKKLGDKGSMEYSKIISKKDLAATDIKNEVTYKYTNEPGGFGYKGYKKDDQNYLKNTYIYYTECTDMRGITTKYTYNGLHDLLSVEEKGKDHKGIIKNTYYENKLPQKKETCFYQIKNGKIIDSPIIKIENYVYDEYGNLTSYTGPEANRDGNGNPINEEHTVKYTYATDKYHILSSKSWKKDENTVCQIKYQLDNKGNIIKEEKHHKENGQNKPVVITYKYDQYGNMIQKNIDGKYIKNYEYGIDENGVDHKGSYMTKEYSSLDAIDVSKKYTYDFNTGSQIAIIDENQNKTSYTYDDLNRLVKILYPDNSWNKYNHVENSNFNRKIVYIDSKEPNCSTSYSYDIFDNLIEKTVDLQKACQTLKKIEYDSNGNKIKELDVHGHSTRYKYDSANRLIKKSFWENDDIEKKCMTLEYTLDGNSSTPLIVTETDEEGYKKKSYYDIQDRLIKLEETPDKSKYYTTKYTYDYVGNRISEIDRRSNAITYTYDDLNMLIKKRDSIGNEEKYYYDACGNLIQKKNAKGASMYYEYDELGRLIREKSPASDGGLAITRYVYDGVGNKIKEITPNYYDTTKDTFELIHTMDGLSYTYDNMNRLESILSTEGNIIEYRKYDERGNLIKVVDGLRYNGNVDQAPGKTFYYDYLNRLTYSSDTKGNSTHYEYDLIDNLLEKKDARNNITKFEYNADGTLNETVFPDGGTIEYTYDKLGRKLTEKDQRGNVTSYNYNGFGQVTSVKDPYNHIIEYDYDANGNLICETDKKGNKITYIYDKNNRLLEKKVPLEINNGTIIYSVQKHSYDELGSIKKIIETGTKDTESKRETNFTYYNNNLVDTITNNSGRYICFNKVSTF